MKINFILNGEDVTEAGQLHESIFAILKRETRLFKDHVCCQRGLCGRCQVTLDGRSVPGCLTPAFMVVHREIVTPEGFRQTEDFKKFWKFLETTQMVFCSQCTDAQVFSLHSFLEANPSASEQEIRALVSEIPCRCGTRPNLVKAALMFTGTKEAVRGTRR